MLNPPKREKNRVSLPILLQKTRQRRDVTYDVIDELRRLGLSKCFLALCHKLIYEIAIFHSINRETCDKLIYEIAIFHSINGETCDKFYFITFLTRIFISYDVENLRH